MSNLWLPPNYQRRNVQMAKAVVFWFSKKLDHILLPAAPLCPAPTGYQRIECIHAKDVDLWSDKLRAQEKRVREMTDEERYNFEEPIRAHGIAELRKALKDAVDPANRLFLVRSIERLEQKREERRKEYVESYMACEAQEKVAH